MKKNNHSPIQTVRMLSFRSNIPQRQVRAVFSELVKMVCAAVREGPFVIPGICRIELSRRSGRTGYNPHTGERFAVPARTSVRVRLLPRVEQEILAPILKAEAEARAAEAAEKAAKPSVRHVAKRKNQVQGKPASGKSASDEPSRGKTLPKQSKRPKTAAAARRINPKK